jgi:hypothetical protein
VAEGDGAIAAACCGGERPLRRGAAGGVGMDLHICWILLCLLWGIEDGGKGIAGRRSRAGMRVDVGRLGMRTVVARRHRFASWDLGGHHVGG